MYDQPDLKPDPPHSPISGDLDVVVGEKGYRGTMEHTIELHRLFTLQDTDLNKLVPGRSYSRLLLEDVWGPHDPPGSLQPTLD